ncbi:MAG: tetraacyldisaccharide 4'-kinase [Desulfosoma sp.]
MGMVAHRVFEWLWYGTTDDLGRRIAARLLRPLEKLYLAGLRFDQTARRRQCQSLPCPVVSIGNLTVGGTGKTPAVLWIARHLAHRGLTVTILSRGYGRSGSETVKVQLDAPTHELAGRYGDEPVLLARTLPHVSVWVGSDRAKSGSHAVDHDHPDIIVLDDGFQHLQLHRDLDFVLLDAARPLGNGKLLPAGPLREPPEHLVRAHAIVLVGETRNERQAVNLIRGYVSAEIPIFRARLEPEGFYHAATMEPLGIAACPTSKAGDDFIGSKDFRPAMYAGGTPELPGTGSLSDTVPGKKPLSRELLSERATHGEGFDGKCASFKNEPARLKVLEEPCLAVAGIARPERFFNMLRHLGITCRASMAFPDHHRWTLEDVRALRRKLQTTGARWVVTTEKDAVRMPPALAERALFLRIRMDFGSDTEPLVRILWTRLKA